MISIETILGYALFILSELISIIPIPANGLLHSFTIGIKNSFKNPNTNIEMAQTLLNKNPKLSTLIHKLNMNTNISDSITRLLENPENIKFIDLINNDNKIQYIITLLNNNPNILNNITTTVEKEIVLHKQNIPISQTQPDTIINVLPDITEN
jgi:hypothetical protein